MIYWKVIIRGSKSRPFNPTNCFSLDKRLHALLRIYNVDMPVPRNSVFSAYLQYLTHWRFSLFNQLPPYILCCYHLYSLVLASCLFCRHVRYFTFFVLAFDFCRFCVIIRFVHPRHNGQRPPTSKDFYPRFYPLHFLSYLLFFRKSQYFPFYC